MSRKKVEDTSKRDPLIHLLGHGIAADKYITDMEKAGQMQLVHSEQIPRELIGCTEETLTALRSAAESRRRS
jgi:hypothetical protein